MSQHVTLPLGVAVLSVVVGIFGAFLLFAGLIVVMVALLNLAMVGWAGTFGGGAITGLITLAFGALILGVAFGLWHQELWAFVLALIATGLAVIWFIALPVYGGAGVGALVSLPAIVSGVLFVYLLAVHDHFY